LKPRAFELMALDRLLVLAPLVGMAGVHASHTHSSTSLSKWNRPKSSRIVALAPPRAHIYAGGRRLALAFISMTSAAMIDVAFLLDLSDHRTAAGMAGHQPGEGEVTVMRRCFFASWPSITPRTRSKSSTENISRDSLEKACRFI
jgi:hypothetical protein